VWVAAVFWPLRDHAWLNYDDDVYVTRVPQVAEGWSPGGVAWAFTSLEGANYFPLTRLSWMLDAELYGLDAGGFHTTSLLLHALATSLLFLALAGMTGCPGRSAFVAAVFGVHPLHVESVAWIAARKDTLSGVCFAAALLAYAPGGTSPRSALRMAGVSLLHALGLLAKQTLVTLPLLLLLLDAWPLGRLRSARDARRALLEKLPLLALSVAAGALTVIAQSRGGTIADLERLSLAARLANAGVATVHYLADAVWPSGLAVFYPHPQGGTPPALWAGAWALLAAFSAGALLAARRFPAVCVGWLWFLVALAPVSGVVQVGSQARADRYTYLPLIGLALAAAWGGSALLARWVRLPSRRQWVSAALGVATVVALSAACAHQLRHWRDSESLMRRALAVTRGNATAHAHLGSALLERGAVDEAVLHWRQAAELQPGFLQVTNNLAWLLATASDPRHRAPAEALRLARRAALMAPDDPAVLDTLAAAQAAAGRFEAASVTAARAAERARERGDPALAREIEQRAAGYRRGRAHRGG
jgi:tetratricopeptide (TPR) repeat protein